MSSTILGTVEKKMKAVSEGLRQELSTIRTGRASPALIEHLKVDYAGVADSSQPDRQHFRP
jgi:ribosome recycling factor